MKSNDKKDIILITCPVWGVQMPSLGLAYLATNLKKRGINLEVSDLNIEVYKRVNNKLKELWKFENNKYWCYWDKDFKELFKEEIEYCIKRILSFSNTKIYAFSIQATNRWFSIEIIKRIKKANPDKIIIVGGVGCFDDKEREQIFPLELVDFFIIGEGEASLFRLVDRLKKGFIIENIPGVVYYKRKEKKLTLPQLIEPLDRLYFPTYEEFDLKNYTEKSLALTMSRGCISRCAFCNDWKMMGKYRTRSAEHMFKEIKYHVEKNNITNFYFNDLLINGNIKELEKLCDLIIKSNYKLAWVALAIPLDSMNYNLLVKMRKAGCITLNYGVESGSDRVLKKIGKPISVNSVEKVLELTRKAGINTQLNFIVGFPGEKEEDVEKTISFIKKNRKNICGITNINICNVVTGSELSINTKKYGLLFPNDAKLRDSHWYTLSGNTFEERKRRAERVIKVLNDLNLPIFTTNLKEKVADISKINSKTKVEGIVLVNLPPWGVNNPPLSLACLSEYLKSKNIETEVFDFNIQLYNKVKEGYSNLWHVENKNYWSNDNLLDKIIRLINKDIEEWVNKIIDSNIGIIAFSVVDPKERLVIYMIKKIKEKRPNIKIILGGPACATPTSRGFFEERIPKLIDAYIVGEGEETLSEVINKINQNMPLEKVSGVVVFKNNRENNFIPREPLKPEEIPSPTYNDFDLSQYSKGNSLLMEWSRGCIANCAFCIGKLMLGKYRFKEPNKIVKEVKYYVKEKGITNFTIVDNLINGDLKKLDETCDLIIKNNLKISWSCEGIGIEMQYPLLKKMKEAGCNEFQIGVESGSEIVLRRMRKPYTAKSAESLIRGAKRAGLKTEIFIMIGFPGETESEFNKTLEFIKRNKDYIDLVKSINILHLIAGTDVRDNYKKYGITLPKKDYYYKWYTKDSSMEIRNNRVKGVINLINNLGIPFLETNIMEGKDKKSDNLRYIDNIITLKLAKDVNYDKGKTSIENERTEEERINISYKKDKPIRNLIKRVLEVKKFFKSSNNINKIEQIRKKLIPTPKYVTIDLTNSCNLNCIGCWTHSPLLKDKEASKEWKSQIIPFDTLKKLIEDLHDLGTERIRLTGGGEPFLYPKIMEAIRLIKEKGMACDITTNFVLLTKKEIKKLFKLNIDELVVSIWAGDAETYVKTHPNQTQKTFDRIKANLEFIAQYKEKVRKGPKVIMANVISNINYNKIEEIARFATNVSLDEIYFTPIDPIKGRTDILLLNNKERKILLKKLNNAIKIVEAYNKKSKTHKIKIDDINRFIGKIKSRKADEGQYDLSVINKPCYISYIFTRVLSNGDIVPCCRAVMYPMGNINKKSFKNIWFSEEYDKFRERALYESKLSPYFKKIGCCTTCDNQVHNREIEDSMRISKNIKIQENNVRKVYDKKSENLSKIFKYFKVKTKNIKNKYDLLLIVCPPWGLSSPPLGPSYLSSFLNSKGYKTKVLDLNIILHNKSKDMQKYWEYNFKDYWLDQSSFEILYNQFSEEIEEFISQIIDTKCKLIGFSAYQNNIKVIIKLAFKIKKINPNIKIIVGGPSCSIERERKNFYKPFIDFIVIGEGEKTLCDLLKYLKNRVSTNRLSKIPGLIIPSLIKNKNFIERSPLNPNEMVNYRNNIELTKKYSNPPMISMFMSKGCIGKCTFCNDRNLMGKYRVRPAEQVINEIKYYVDNGITLIIFNDLLINGDIKELEKLCDLIIKDNISIFWTANVIALKNLTLKRMRKIKKAGCSTFMMGIESGSNKILKDINKLTTPETIEKVLRDCKKAGIKTWVNFIIGYPTETEEDFKQTLKFIEKNAKYMDKILNANMCCVEYNSELMSNRDKWGIELPDDKNMAEMTWYTKDGKNNIQIRKRRLKILLKKAKSLGLPVEQTNLKVIDNYMKKLISV